jgi:predicted DNA-binding protein
MTARTAMRLPGEMNARLLDLAKREAVSVTAIIRRAIAREIELANTYVVRE